MNFVTFKYTGSEAIPAEVTLGEHTTPVWIQQKWEEGQYAEYVRKNGCGHCCTAMAARLRASLVALLCCPGILSAGVPGRRE